MRKNIDKWNHWKSLIEERDQEYISSVLSSVPTILHKVQRKRDEYVIEDWEVEKVTYRHKPSLFFYGKNPTRADVRRIEGMYENGADSPYCKDNVIIHIKFNNGKWSSSTGVSLVDLEEGRHYHLDKDVAEEKRQDLDKKLKHELHLLENGHIRCKYCSKVVKEEAAVEYKIISYANYGPGGKVFKYCRKECGVHDQMTHEG